MHHLRPWLRVFALARPHARLLLAGTLALLIGSAASLAAPMLIQQMVDAVGEGAGQEAVNRVGLGLVGLFFVSGVFGALRSWLFTIAGERVVTLLRRDLYAAIIRQEVGFFDARRTGELTNRLSSDTTALQNAVTVNVSMLLRYGVMGLGALGILMWTSLKLTAVMLAIVPVVAVGSTLYGRVLRKVSRQVQDALATATAVAEETISGVRTVRVFAREPQEIARFGEAVEHSYELARRRATMVALAMGGFSFAGYSAIAVVLWYGGVLLVEGRMTLGELTSFLLYTMTVAFSLSLLASLWSDFQKAFGASERVFELLDRQPEVAGGEERLPGVRGEVRFEAVDFRYPTRPDVPVLRGLDLALPPGEIVALVGPSGGGKSTVAALVSRLYDPTSGRLLLDARPYDQLDPAWLREQVGVVPQEPILFATSVAENIRYGRPDASDEQVRAAATAANAHDFVSAFPEGYETLVGERGVRLSGGQKQRIAIARAILKDPCVLVLDEATSALDAASEHLVQEALDRLMRGRTTLIIAHRLSTVKSADRVVVLDDGVVQQQGSHADLLASDGLYRRLVERQFAAPCDDS